MRCVVTGCAGFIGSHLTERLLKEGYQVVGIDNFSTGFQEFLSTAKQSPAFTLIKGDLLDKQTQLSFKGCDIVFHLAANADVRFGVDHPEKDLQQNTFATFQVLEAMRQYQIPQIVFASTGSIYGEPSQIPTPEDVAFPQQTSLYGASKLAAEGLIQAYCEAFSIRAHIFRFVSILGERYTHGHVLDFLKQLKKDPEHLYVLGNGRQKKSYLYVQDCMDAILLTLQKAKGEVNIFNLGTNEYCEVNNSIQWICEYLNLSPKITYAGGDRGWVGDNPFIFLDTKRIQSLGWVPRFSIQQSIIKTITYLMENAWILEQR